MTIFQKFRFFFAVFYFIYSSILLVSAQTDKKGIEFSSEMQHDSVAQFLVIPSDPEDDNFTMASTVPAIDFAIQQGLEPWDASSIGGIWGGWGRIGLGPDNNFYYSFGNHANYGGNAYILKYDPNKKEQSVVFSSKNIAGWTDSDYGDGKLHGDPDVSPDGDMWVLSFFGPQPSQTLIDAGDYKGGILIHHNIYTNETEYLGQPVYGKSWPYHSWDWENNVLFAVTDEGNFVMAYDTENQTVLYQGQPTTSEGDVYWYKRGIILDRETGIFYSNDMSPSMEGSGRFISYDPATNIFTLMESTAPAHTDGKHYPARANTFKKDDEGAFWCADFKGNLFRFFPQEDSIENIGKNWGDGRYMGSMCFSHDKNYIYYALDAGTDADRYGTPIVQFNVKERTKKVLAFLRDFYVDEYGYNPGGTYGTQIDSTGKYLFFYVNGKFTSGSSGYGRPSIFCLNIPEAERPGASPNTYLSSTTCDLAMVRTDTVKLVNQHGFDSLVITETTLLPSDTTRLIDSTCNPLEVSFDTLFLANQYSCDSLVITETILLLSDTVVLTESILLGESFQIGDSVFTISGRYTVVLANQYGCDSLITLNLAVEEPVNTISINEQSTQIKVYPNPTDGYINLSIENNRHEIRINILSETGQIIFDNTYFPLESEIMEQIDLKNYPNGIYFIQVISGDFKKIKKFVLNK